MTQKPRRRTQQLREAAVEDSLAKLPFRAWMQELEELEQEDEERPSSATTSRRVPGASYHDGSSEGEDVVGPLSFVAVWNAAAKAVTQEENGGGGSTTAGRLKLRADALQPVPTLPAPTNAIKGLAAAPCMRRWVMASFIRG